MLGLKLTGWTSISTASNLDGLLPDHEEGNVCALPLLAMSVFGPNPSSIMTALDIPGMF